MIEKSQEYLRLALAAAAILVGLSVAYHYVFYIPQRDRAQELGAGLKAAEAARLQKEKRATETTAALERRTNYRICLSAAVKDYGARWDSSCRSRSVAAERSRANCIEGAMAEDVCQTTYPPTPTADCTLPSAISENYSEALEDEKKRCLDEARSDVLAPL